jgi:uncharacterized protein (DUF1330 family)
MAAFVIVDVDVKDKERYEEYKKLTPGSLVPFGGRFVVRGGKVETLEGTWSPKRLVILEFPTVAKAREWWGSETYWPAKALRQSCAETEMILVEGV